jgi:hypothetical protein
VYERPAVAVAPAGHDLALARAISRAAVRDLGSGVAPQHFPVSVNRHGGPA